MEKEKILEIMDSFKEDYGKYSNYIIGYGVSNLKIAEKEGFKFKLGKNEALEDLCIMVHIEKELPKKIEAKLPKIYKGVRIFYKVVGEIKEF